MDSTLGPVLEYNRSSCTRRRTEDNNKTWLVTDQNGTIRDGVKPAVEQEQNMLFEILGSGLC